MRRRLSGLLVAAALAASGPAPTALAGSHAPFASPVDAPVIRPFRAPPAPFAAGHRGVDYGVPPGTPVRAAGPGRVAFAAPVAGEGLFVTLDHGRGLVTTYSYLSALGVGAGVSVERGEVVGLSGDGHPGGPPLLHFGVRVGGRYMDPEALIEPSPDDVSGAISLAPLEEEASLDGPSGRPPPSAVRPARRRLLTGLGAGLAAFAERVRAMLRREPRRM